MHVEPIPMVLVTLSNAIVITIIICCMIEKQHFCNDYSYANIGFYVFDIHVDVSMN
jgi:hypothetical protein